MVVVMADKEETGRIFRRSRAEYRERGNGVRTADIARAGTVFVTGITEFAPGAGLGLHFHNCDESVIVMEGVARFDMNDESHELESGDATYVPAGVVHRFVNAGSNLMRLFFVYGSDTPTRTMVDTGETIAVGSYRDVVR